MSFEIEGKLAEKTDVIIISDTFKKRDFVIEKITYYKGKEYSDFIKFQITQERCGIIDNINIGDDVIINFNIKGRRWEKDGKSGVFTNLEAYSVGGIARDDEPVKQKELPLGDSKDDDLPF